MHLLLWKRCCRMRDKGFNVRTVVLNLILGAVVVTCRTGNFDVGIVSFEQLV